jgi:enoyl-CoA hydratase
VSGDEALAFGLANRLAEPGAALDSAVELAHELARLPQLCLRSDRRSSYEQWALALDDALLNEFERGAATIASGETLAGATRFASGAGRHGEPAS